MKSREDDSQIKLIGSFLLLHSFQEVGMSGVVMAGLVSTLISLAFSLAVLPKK